MATLPTYELALDTTGTLVQNRITAEEHILEPGKVRAISLLKGLFFEDSLHLDADGFPDGLRENVDYIITEHYDHFYALHKRRVAGMVVIINESVPDEVYVTYNAVGDFYSTPNMELRDFINQNNKFKAPSSLYWELLDNYSPFLPANSADLVGSRAGMEHFIYGLEKIRSAILLSDFDASNALTDRLDNFVQTLSDRLTVLLEGSYKDQTEAFKAEFNAVKAKLGKVVNMKKATEEEAADLADPSTRLNISKDRYLTLSGLSAFKARLYNLTVSRSDTSIGEVIGQIRLPRLVTLESMVNGAVGVFKSHEELTLNGVEFDELIYPDLSDKTCRWSITKVTNNINDGGGILHAVNMKTGEFYIGVLKAALTAGLNPRVTYRKLYNEYEMERALDLLAEHGRNKGAAHKETAFQLGLGNIENIPPVTMKEVAARTYTRKMVTWKTAALFLSAFGDLPNIDQLKDAENCDATIIKKIQLIFTPCGPCGPCCRSDVPPPDVTIEPQDIVDANGTYNGFYCQGSTRIGVFADGLGGVYLQETEDVDGDCTIGNP